MIKIRSDLKPSELTKKIVRIWAVSAPKILSADKDDVPGQSAPVFTWDGKYTVRGWTEWTQRFAYGSALLQYDATGDDAFLKLGRDRTFGRMAPHLTHIRVNDHGFNNVSTYGNLLRLLHEGRIPDAGGREKDYYELALKLTGAVQADCWTEISDGGFIYSFNGPHSVFADTIRSCRAQAVSRQLGHILIGERDTKIRSRD